MKLLLFSDLHCDVTAAERLLQLSPSVDVLVGAGDFGNCRRNVAACIDVLKTVSQPAVLVPGNNESTEQLVEACRSWKQSYVLHGNGATINGITFFGIGGGIPITPFGAWSNDFTEDQATELLRNCPQGCVFVSHSPPKGLADVASNGQHLGSIAVREVIERTHPQLVVCGHIHASAGQTVMLNSTTIINVGPAGIVWTLDSSEFT